MLCPACRQVYQPTVDETGKAIEVLEPGWVCECGTPTRRLTWPEAAGQYSRGAVDRPEFRPDVEMSARLHAQLGCDESGRALVSEKVAMLRDVLGLDPRSHDGQVLLAHWAAIESERNAVHAEEDEEREAKR